MELELRYYGDRILRERAREVEVFDDGLAELGRSMIELMHRERGVGLAGPQVGEGRRILIALQMGDIEDDHAEPLVVVNPEILERSTDTWVLEEGCLSIPGINGEVTRAVRMRLRYQDVEGREHEIDAEGMFARILQHEIDHLNGRLFIDYLSPAKKSLIKPRLKAIAAGDV
jgi:peptide deformylase